MAEAGAEEAMAQLNPGALDKNISVDFTANGWGSPSGGIYGPKNSQHDQWLLLGGLFSRYLPHYILHRLHDASSLNHHVAACNQNRHHQRSLFNVSMAARTNIDMSGNGVSTDSYDSANTNLSTNGRMTHEGRDKWRCCDPIR